MFFGEDLQFHDLMEECGGLREVISNDLFSELLVVNFWKHMIF